MSIKLEKAQVIIKFMKELSSRFTKGVEAIKSLAKLPRYQAAFVFGSVAEGISTEKSDLDVRVIVDNDNACQNVNHPIIDGYKLDLSFKSFRQIEEAIEEDIKKAERRPVLAGALIVFDKTGQLTNLKQKADQARPKQLLKPDYLYAQFMLHHANDKVERYLHNDPVSSLYSMHANIGDVLKYHYQLNGRWWVSSKKIMADLESWDPELASLLKHFVSTSEVKTKFKHWSEIMDYVTTQMGGRQAIADNNCDCEVCQADLANLGL